MKKLLLTLPFLLAAVLALVRPMVAPTAGLLPLLAFVPALAAWTSGQMTAGSRARGAYTAIAGVFALVSASVSQVFLPAAEARELVAYAAVILVTAISIASAFHQERTDLDLIGVRAVADLAQDVILRPLPARAGQVSLAARCVTGDAYSHLGGDFYEAVATGPLLRLVMGDVQGHGRSAVRIMALALGIFREAAWRERGIADVAAAMDYRLCHELGDEQFVTAVLVEIDTDAGHATVVCCGHPPPLLLTALGAAQACPEAASPPLGLGLGRWPGIRQVVPFKPGYSLLLYTDGVSEARDALGRFFPLLERAVLESPDALVGSLVSQAQDHARGGSRDDMAILVAHHEELPLAPGRAGQASAAAQRSPRERPQEGWQPVSPGHALVV